MCGVQERQSAKEKTLGSNRKARSDLTRCTARAIMKHACRFIGGIGTHERSRRSGGLEVRMSLGSETSAGTPVRTLLGYSLMVAATVALFFVIRFYGEALI